MHDTLKLVHEALSQPPHRLDLSGLKTSAVALLFDPSGELWFMKRAARKSDPWSGQISFPGGRAEPSDTDLMDTAIRETWEEVGLKLRRDQCLGALDDLRTRPVTNMMIRPFVFILDEAPEFAPNEEVSSLHCITLRKLLSGEGRDMMTLERGEQSWEFPKVDLEGHPLWGLTLHIVDSLLDRIDNGGVGSERIPAT